MEENPEDPEDWTRPLTWVAALGMLRDWTPWLVAAAPSTLYLLLSMAAFGWLVRYR